MLNTINVAAAVVLVVWACWCGFSRSVNDGIVGKLIYFSISVASFGLIRDPMNMRGHTILIVAFAMLGIRHYWLRYVKKQILKKVHA